MSAQADRLAETTERVAARIDSMNEVIAGRPIFYSLWASLFTASEDLKHAAAEYRRAGVPPETTE